MFGMESRRAGLRIKLIHQRLHPLRNAQPDLEVGRIDRLEYQVVNPAVRRVCDGRGIRLVAEEQHPSRSLRLATRTSAAISTPGIVCKLLSRIAICGVPLSIRRRRASAPSAARRGVQPHVRSLRSRDSVASLSSDATRIRLKLRTKGGAETARRRDTFYISGRV
jgi:hypothetical protein